MIKIYIALFLCFFLVEKGYSQNPDDAGLVNRDKIPCNKNNGDVGTITIANKTLTGNLFITAKTGLDGSVIAEGIIYAGSTACSQSVAGPVVIQGIAGGIADPASSGCKAIGDVDFRAESAIYLQDGFTAEEGCSFHAYIKPDWNTEHPVWVENFHYGLIAKGLFNYDNPTDPTHRLFLERWQAGPHQSRRVGRNQIAFVDEPQNPSQNSDGHDTVVVFFPGICVTTATNSSVPQFMTVDQLHTSQEACGRYEFLAKWPVNKSDPQNASTWNTMLFGAWLQAQGNTCGDEIDIVERHGVPGQPNLPSQSSPHYFGAQVGSWHNIFHPWMEGHEVDQAVSYMPPFDQGYNWFSLEWECDEIRFLVNDYVICRFPNLHANNGVPGEGKGGINYNMAKNALREPVNLIFDILQFKCAVPINSLHELRVASARLVSKK